jgi:hypothetical protein
MGKKTLIRSAVGIVSFFFTISGSFLLKIAPPEEIDARFATGIAFFSVLIVLLVVSNLKSTRKQAHSRIWLKIALIAALVGVLAGITYKFSLDRFTFAWPPESKEKTFVAGFTLTDSAKKYQESHPFAGNADLVADFGGIARRELVWNSFSIEMAKTLLLGTYLAMVLSFATSVFSLVEHSAKDIE